MLYPQLPELPLALRAESYSPTSSEVDALEESFYDYEIQSSNVAQKASSANYNYINDDDTDSTTSSTYLSLPDTADDTLADAPRSLKDRLRFVWRMLCLYMRCPVPCVLIKCSSSIPTRAARRSFCRPLGVAQGRCSL